MKLITGITNGKVVDQERLNEIFLSYEGKKVDITVERHKTKATNPQRRYFFGVIFKNIAKFMADRGEDHTPEDYYNHYKNKGYFGYTEIMGEPTPKGLSIATTLETSEAKERLQREWSEKGLDIPDPNEEDYRLGKEYQPPTED